MPCCFRKFIKIYGFNNVTIRSKVVAFDKIYLLLRRGQNHDGEATGSFISTDSLKNLEAVELGQFDVEQNDLRQSGFATCKFTFAKEKVECLFTVSSYGNLIGDLTLAYGPDRQELIILVIFD